MLPKHGDFALRWEQLSGRIEPGRNSPAGTPELEIDMPEATPWRAAAASAGRNSSQLMFGVTGADGRRTNGS